MRYVGGNGVEACRSTPYGVAYPGECKQFVNCIIYQASGGTQQPGGSPDYFGSFIAAGGIEVSQAAAVKGDIIQWGSGSTASQHTAIVLENRGNGVFHVVDSNSQSDHIVRDYDISNINTYISGYTPRFARMGGVFEPFGSFDSVSEVAAGTVRVRGWAADPNAKAGPLQVHVYANGKYVVALTANKYRPDVASVFPGYGSYLGFDDWINLPVSGSVQVCVYGINQGAGSSNTQLGCRTLNVSNPNPFGSLDGVSEVAAGTIRVRGWAADPNAKAGPLQVHVYVNGQYVVALTANKNRPDVASVFPGYGSYLGFDDWINLRVSGSVQVCVYGINQGAGFSNTQLGCRTLNVSNPNPFGSLDGVTPVAAGTVRVRGWAADPNAKAGPLQVHVYANGKYVGLLTANKYRPDVASVFPGYGSYLGFDDWIYLATSGSVQVCVYGINQGAGFSNTQLGCRIVNV